MEITSIESLRQRRQQLRSDHEQTKAELDRRHAYFAANKFTILWDTFSPFGAGEKSRSRVMEFVKSSVLPMLGGKGLILQALLPTVENFVSRYAVTGFRKFMNKFKRNKSAGDEPNG